MGETAIIKSDSAPAPLVEHSGRGTGRETPSRTFEQKFRRSAFLVLLFFIPVFLSLTPAAVADPDVWWHLRTGQWITQHHAIPTTDPFSRFGGKPWIYSWLFDVVLYTWFRCFDLLGIVFFQVALSFAITLALFALVRRVQTTPWKCFALTSSALLAMAPMFAPRPWLFTILFFTVEVHILLRARETGNLRPLWLLPPLFAVWANLHLQFVYGLFVLGLAAIEPWVLRWLPSSEASVSAQVPARRMWLITALCLVATLASPYHLKVYWLIAKAALPARGFAQISEFQAPLFRSVADFLVLGIAMAGVFALAWRRDRSPFNWLLLATSTLISFRMARDVWFVVVVAAAIISCWNHEVGANRYRPSKQQLLAIAAAVLVLALATVRSRHLSAAELQRVVARTYPAGAAKYVEDRQPAGPLYNDFDWGGYLIWRLPSYPVTMDGRGGQRIERYNTWMAKDGWASDQELSTARLVIANLDLPLTTELRRDPRFQLVYQDKVAAVFLTRTSK